VKDHDSGNPVLNAQALNDFAQTIDVALEHGVLKGGLKQLVDLQGRLLSALLQSGSVHPAEEDKEHEGNRDQAPRPLGAGISS
jgi:hypothetical protein